jgi:hypothetical protein
MPHLKKIGFLRMYARNRPIPLARPAWWACVNRGKTVAGFGSGRPSNFRFGLASEQSAQETSYLMLPFVNRFLSSAHRWAAHKPSSNGDTAYRGLVLEVLAKAPNTSSVGVGGHGQNLAEQVFHSSSGLRSVPSRWTSQEKSQRFPVPPALMLTSQTTIQYVHSTMKREWNSNRTKSGKDGPKRPRSPRT